MSCRLAATLRGVALICLIVSLWTTEHDLLSADSWKRLAEWRVPGRAGGCGAGEDSQLQGKYPNQVDTSTIFLFSVGFPTLCPTFSKPTDQCHVVLRRLPTRTQYSASSRPSKTMSRQSQCRRINAMHSSDMGSVPYLISLVLWEAVSARQSPLR